MSVIDLRFRERVAAIEGGAGLNWCFQCGACVGDCPAARYSDRFNPRLIMLRALLGLEDELLREDSVLWECTNCFTCYDRCPQEVKPVDVIIALKNLAARRGSRPEQVQQLSDGIVDTGRSVRVTGVTQKRRSELGLAELDEPPVAELRTILSGETEAGGPEPATESE